MSSSDEIRGVTFNRWDCDQASVNCGGSRLASLFAVGCSYEPCTSRRGFHTGSGEANQALEEDEVQLVEHGTTSMRESCAS